MGKKQDKVVFIWSALGLGSILMSACASHENIESPKPGLRTALVSAASAAAPEPVRAPAGPLSALRATIVTVDGGTVTVKDNHGKTRVFRVAMNAAVTRGGDIAPADLADIRPGERVTVKYADDVAASIHVNVFPASRRNARRKNNSGGIL